jgi:ABC-type transport system involved in multi-copper enzyme maturation permease subunit
MNHIWLLTKITFKEGIRSNVLYGIAILSGLLFISNLFITQLFALELGKVAIDVGFSILSLAGLSIIFFLGIGLVSKDLHQKNICMVICHPIPRWKYVIGKFSGLALFLVVAIGILGLFAALSLWAGTLTVGALYVTRDFSWGMLFLAVFFNLLSLLVVLAVGFLFTVVTTSLYLSMLLTFCVYLIGNTLDTIVKVLVRGDFAHADALFIKGMKLLTWIFPNLSAFDLKSTLAYGLPQSAPYLAWLASYGLTYAGIVIIITAVILHHKDIS